MMLNNSNDDGADSAVRQVVDSDSEAKLERAKSDIIAQMCKQRPRLITAFEQIGFKANKVVLTAPTEVLKEELYAAKEDILTHIAQIAGVEGVLEMEVLVREVKLNLKPIKLEDRIEHIRKVAPEFDTLQKMFDLDIE